MLNRMRCRFPARIISGVQSDTPAIGVWADATLLSSQPKRRRLAQRSDISADRSAGGRLARELIGYGPEAFGVLASGGSEAKPDRFEVRRDQSRA